jgi:uncharacterized protein (TIGR00299 family) protein
METSSRCLIFDPFAGLAGDMILAGLIDLGLSRDWLQELILGTPVDATLSVTAVVRGAISAPLVTVETAAEQPERRLDDILAIIDSAAVDQGARETAASVFRRLADVEGAIHGVPPERIHFHEVGAADAIVDILGAAAGIAQLGVTDCFTRPVAIGRGWIDAAHGALPVPAPATLRLLEGIPVFESDFEGEITTPTGAALLSALTGGKPAPGLFVPVRSGFGAGTRDPSTHPNCLRLVLADLQVPGPMFVLQADIDDMSPEFLPPLVQSLFDAGATDVSSHPVQMKKGRTGLRIEVLAHGAAIDSVQNAILSESTTLGLRFWHVQRQVLPRTTNRIEWRGFSIRIKSSVDADGHVRHKAEYDDIIAAAQALDIPPLRAKEEIERQLGARDVT